ncbi:excinuclease ABC subunit UvrA [bacterium]|nr:excinuclease ABC subunit UvrA [bacterium]
MSGKIVIRGAKEHNLKSIDLDIPHNKLIVITGLSGSGKSSLAFDTIYAEGQRKYVESLSAYARQFLEQMKKPDVEHIEGLSPAISIEQRSASYNPRSTVATSTEIYDYLRLLFARIGIPHCPKCGKIIKRQTVQEIVDQILSLPEGSRILILAQVVRGRKGEHIKLLENIKKDGFVRLRIDGEIKGIDEKIVLDKNKKHNIDVIVDRIIVGHEITERLTDSVETALRISEGIITVSFYNNENPDRIFSEKYACIDCSVNIEELSPRMFSFNSPYGACPKCHGLGTTIEMDADLVIPDKNLSLRQWAVMPWKKANRHIRRYYSKLINKLGRQFGFDPNTPFCDINEETKKILLYGERTDKNDIHFFKNEKNNLYEGIIPQLERLYRETSSEHMKKWLSEYTTVKICPECKGARLRIESKMVTVSGKNICEISKLAISRAKIFFDSINLSNREKLIGKEIIKEIRNRLTFLTDVGLGYLSLDRQSSTLSGGEAQRIRLATQIGAGLVGVLYVLDEPSIGLHQRDNLRLIDTLHRLKNLGNTVIVVEHDQELIKSADHIIDLGPGAGRHGGYIVAQGCLENIINSEKSLTGMYLSGKKTIKIPEKRKKSAKNMFLTIQGAQQNNLKSINVKIPLGLFTCVTGVSGSGKSSLIDDILRRALFKHFYRSKEKPGKHKSIKGLEFLDKAVVIDQSPIGRTPRSNPATYIGLYTLIRDLFSKIPEAKMRGYKPGRFSFNVKGGRCEACRGDGILKIEMHFLPDIYVECEACKGKRYNRETLEILYKGKNISDVLEFTVSQALGFFQNIPSVKRKLQTLNDVGLGYIKLGQPATTLSGGEAQRIKLSAQLSKKATGNTIYLLDEPTTRLHFDDIHKLLDVLIKLRNAGNTIVVIEHNLDVIKTADYIIDLGPEGGDKGGYLIAQGAPESITNCDESYTGQFLKKIITKPDKKNVKAYGNNF